MPNLKNMLFDVAKDTGTDYVKSGLGIMTAIKVFIYFMMAVIAVSFTAGLYALFTN